MSRVLRPITVNGIRYSVLRLDGGQSNVRFLLRSESGELFGVYARNAQAALSAVPLKLTLSIDNPFKGVDLASDALKQSAQMTRLFRRLHAHTLIAKIPHSRRWRVSLSGRPIMAAALKLREVAYPSLYADAA